MSSRLESLQRLMNLYTAVEQMHATELQRMTAAVHETQQAIAMEQSTAQMARSEGRDALAAGDRAGWTVSEIRQQTAGLRRQRLEEIRLQRQKLNDAAREQYVASRLKKEQMKRVSDEMEFRAEIEEGRRVQAVSDDLFLSRRRWTDMTEKTEESAQMKAS
ncbi:hypothetical protein [Granulicella sp. S190]|uniref:hypothetical protein n=1 Tax=Granulicella sp. S190 TaxID=1747226 RepID=UPI00131DABCE|nr:hypothetical protein [Granulicella sp. S190]